MQAGFWKNMEKPIMVVAPMANVTDAAFRRMFAKYGRPDVFWTEFVSVEGLLSEGKEMLLPDFWYSESEHPIVAQIFGAKPEQFESVAKMIVNLGFDGIDINMGCPDRGVEKQGAGAALIKNPELAKEIIHATKKGAQSAGWQMPVSVKTRIGYSKNELAEFLPMLFEEGLAALTLHLRTRNEMSDVPAHWELAPEIVALRNKYAPQTLLLGNGDVATLEGARALVSSSGFDGIMIGRGVFGAPWFFSGETPDIRTRLRILLEHTELFETLYKSNVSKQEGRLKNFDVMKKHYKAYSSGFDGAKELRIALMAANNATDVRKNVEEFLKNLPKD